jgi:hypothetical protein
LADETSRYQENGKSISNSNSLQYYQDNTQLADKYTISWIDVRI